MFLLHQILWKIWSMFVNSVEIIGVLLNLTRLDFLWRIFKPRNSYSAVIAQGTSTLFPRLYIKLINTLPWFRKLLLYGINALLTQIMRLCDLSSLLSLFLVNACQLGKHTKLLFSKSLTKSSKPFELIDSLWPLNITNSKFKWNKILSAFFWMIILITYGFTLSD